MTFVAILVGVLMGSAITMALVYMGVFYSKEEAEQDPLLEEPDGTRSLDPGSPLSRSALNASYAAAVSNAAGGGLLTGLMAQLWSHMNKAIAKSVKETVEPMFKESLPGPLSSLHFTQLDLGSVPMRMDNIIVHDQKDDAVQFDFDISWDGNCEIELKADYVGSFGVKKVKLFGRMSVLLAPLKYELPVTSAVQYCFINPPTLELDFTGLANLADCSLLDSKIRGIIQDTLQSLMVLPNRMCTKLDPVSSYMDIYRPPVGIARVTAIRGSGFQVEKGRLSRDDVPDVYCVFKLGGKEWKTKTIKNTTSPEWSEEESGDFVLSDHDQIISVEVYDEDTGALDSDDFLGSAQVTVGETLLQGKTVTVDLHGGEYKGAKITLNCDICKLTSKLDSLEANKDENLLSGFLTILVTQAEGIPVEKEKAAFFVKVKYGTDNEFVTPTVLDAPGIDSLNPVYDSAFQVPLTPQLMTSKDPIEFQLCNGGETETVLGSMTLTHDELVKAVESTITETRSIGDKGASIKFRAMLQGVEPSSQGRAPSLVPDSGSPDKKMTASATSSSVTHGNALGTVRLTAIKGWGFVEEKRRLHRNDIPDVYCTVTFGSSPNVWRTSTVKNNVAPEWNESSDYLLSDHGQMITLTVFDEDKGKDDDDELGGARITVGKLLLSGGVTDVELQQDGKPTGLFVSLGCEMI